MARSNKQGETANGIDDSGPARRGPSKEKFWRQQIAQQKKSSLSQVKYCQQVGLNPNNFSWWVREIKERDKVKAMEALGDQFRNIQDEIELEETNPFVSVKNVAEPKVLADGYLEIVLPGGARIRVTEKTPMSLLSRVLKMLEVEPC